MWFDTNLNSLAYRSPCDSPLASNTEMSNMQFTSESGRELNLDPWKIQIRAQLKMDLRIDFPSVQSAVRLPYDITKYSNWKIHRSKSKRAKVWITELKLIIKFKLQHAAVRHSRAMHNWALGFVSHELRPINLITMRSSLHTTVHTNIENINNFLRCCIVCTCSNANCRDLRSHPAKRKMVLEMVPNGARNVNKQKVNFTFRLLFVRHYRNQLIYNSTGWQRLSIVYELWHDVFDSRNKQKGRRPTNTCHSAIQFWI